MTSYSNPPNPEQAWSGVESHHAVEEPRPNQAMSQGLVQDGDPVHLLVARVSGSQDFQLLDSKGTQDTAGTWALWFSVWGDLASWGHLAMSGDTFSSYHCGVGATGIQGGVGKEGCWTYYRPRITQPQISIRLRFQNLPGIRSPGQSCSRRDGVLRVPPVEVPWPVCPCSRGEADFCKARWREPAQCTPGAAFPGRWEELSYNIWTNIDTVCDRWQSSSSVLGFSTDWGPLHCPPYCWGHGQVGGKGKVYIFFSFSHEMSSLS